MGKLPVVSVYEVLETGETGSWVGCGSLVMTRAVLVHPPLNEQLVAEREPSSLRVGIYSAADPCAGRGEFLEIVDVKSIHIERGAGPAKPVVGLELLTGTRSELGPVPVIDSDANRDQVLDELAGFLQERSAEDYFPPPPHELPEGVVPYPAPWCIMFRWGC